MRDPHVEALFFSVFSTPGTKYVDPAVLRSTQPLGEFTIDQGILTVRPAEHFSSEREARGAIEPYLRSWEADADLRTAPGAIRFKFERSVVVDRAPPLPGHQISIALAAGASCVTGYAATLTVGRRSYPPPPTAFEMTNNVSAAYRQPACYWEDRTNLPAIGYFVLTMLEGAGSRANAAKVLKIDKSILGEVGRLTAERGGPDSARKFNENGFIDLSDAERQWLEEALRRLVLRFGEHAAGAHLEPITPQNFPLL